MLKRFRTSWARPVDSRRPLRGQTTEPDGLQSRCLIDRAHLDAQTFGDAGLAREVLQLFAQQCRALVPAICADTSGVGARADHAHTLRGSALGVGAGDVAAACASLESALRAGTVAPGQLDRLTAAVDATLEEIEGARHEPDG